MIKVCNALNTSDYDEINGMDCLEYWAQEKNEQPWICRCSGRIETKDDRLVGGHVISIDNYTPHVYIVPMLSSYNSMKNNLKAFNVDESSLVRVPADQERKILMDPANVKEIKRQKAKSF